MVPRLIVLLAILAVAWQVRAAESWHTPTRGTPERQQILDALRAYMHQFDDQPLRFVVRELCVSERRGWLSVDPQSPDGSSHYETLNAPLKRSGERWTIDALACGEEDCAPGTDADALRAQVAPQCP
jgi:hypothetical protein